ncbi:MAG: hypothetical protein K2M42_07035, partial [Oscillospiraceae bacterium]|nr:hypothetical protein [Oscillospiraceae bacterium]
NRRTDRSRGLATRGEPPLAGPTPGRAARSPRRAQGGVTAPAPRREAPPPAQSAPREKPPVSDEVPWEEPPLRDEDAPPWDMDPVPAPKLSPKQAPKQERPAQPAPDPQSKAEQIPAPQASAGGWPGWPAFREQLKGELAVSDYSFLSNSAMAEGRFDGSRLTLWVANDFLRDMLDRPAITRPMGSLCQKLTGVAHQVEVKMGKAPPEDAPAMDALDAFLAQAGDNIIVE